VSEPRATSVFARLHGDAAGILAVKIGGTGLAFGAQLVLARALGADGLGAYALAMALLNALLVFSRMGFDISSLRIAPLLLDDDDRRGLAGFLRVSRRVPALAAVLLSGAAAAGVVLVMEPGFVRASILVATVGLLPWTMVLVDQGRLRALGRRVAAFVPGEVVRPGVLLAGASAGAALGWIGGSSGAPRAVALHLLALIVAALLALRLMRATVPTPVRSADPDLRTSDWIRTSLGLGLVTGLTALLAQVDTLLLGSLADPGDVGLFALARRVAALLGFGLLAVNSAVAPDFSRLYRAGRSRELAALTRRAALLATAATLPPVLAFALFGRWILGWFGPEFPAAYPMLLVFAGGQLVNAACGPVALLATLTGHARTTALVLAGALATLAAGVLWATPRFGVLGTAVVSAGVMAGWNLVMVVVVRAILRKGPEDGGGHG